MDQTTLGLINRGGEKFDPDQQAGLVEGVPAQNYL